MTGPLGPSQSLGAASLTGSHAPDFAIQGCGAGDTVCLIVVDGGWFSAARHLTNERSHHMLKLLDTKERPSTLDDFLQHFR